MKPNESIADRALRGVAAVIVAVLAFTVTSPSRPAGVILLTVATILALTAAVGFCPIYRILGIGTRK